MVKWLQNGRSVFTWFLAACVAVVVGLTAWSTWCGITNFTFSVSGDYARYVSMLWNTAHGRPFYTTEGSYLFQHLSFSLALLSPIYLVADHPLTFVWLALVFEIAGGAIVAAVARRAGLSWMFITAMLLYWCGCHFMHRIQMTGFHTATAYLVLIPLLHWAILVRRGAGIGIVLALILGLREEAGLMVIPLLLYFAVKDRWRAGYLYAGFALAYVALATTVLYPAINDVSLLARRTKEMGTIGRHLDLWPHRMVSLFWIVLPVLPLLRRGWRPLLVIPSVAVLATLLSTYAPQCMLNVHYSAVILATLVVAVIETLRSRAGEAEDGGRRAAVVAVWLLAVTSVSYFMNGMLPGSPSKPDRSDLSYKIRGKAMRAARFARNIPPDASVGVDGMLAAYVANRAEVYWGRTMHDPKIWQMDYVFSRRTVLPSQFMRDQVATGNYRLLREKDGYIILQRGKPASAPPG